MTSVLVDENSASGGNFLDESGDIEGFLVLSQDLLDSLFCLRQAVNTATIARV